MTMKNLIYLWCMVVGLLAANHVFAVVPKGKTPTYVYRVDVRPPAEMFVYGFQSLGMNDDIIAHVNGQTCSKGHLESNFISMFANYKAAKKAALRDLDVVQTAYLYTIRADNNFYSGAESARFVNDYLGRTPSPLGRMSIEMSDRAGEWVAVGSIPAENVMSVRFFERDKPEQVVSFNPNYVDKDTVGNVIPYAGNLGNRSYVQSHYGFPVDANAGLGLTWLSSCFGACSSVSRSCDGIEPRDANNLLVYLLL